MEKTCLSKSTLCQYIDGITTPEIEEHLASCDFCQKRLQSLQREHTQNMETFRSSINSTKNLVDQFSMDWKAWVQKNYRALKQDGVLNGSTQTGDIEWSITRSPESIRFVFVAKNEILKFMRIAIKKGQNHEKCVVEQHPNYLGFELEMDEKLFGAIEKWQFEFGERLEPTHLIPSIKIDFTMTVAAGVCLLLLFLMLFLVKASEIREPQLYLVDENHTALLDREIVRHISQGNLNLKSGDIPYYAYKLLQNRVDPVHEKSYNLTPDKVATIPSMPKSDLQNMAVAYSDSELANIEDVLNENTVKYRLNTRLLGNKSQNPDFEDSNIIDLGYKTGLVYTDIYLLLEGKLNLISEIKTYYSPMMISWRDSAEKKLEIKVTEAGSFLALFHINGDNISQIFPIEDSQTQKLNPGYLYPELPKDLKGGYIFGVFDDQMHSCEKLQKWIMEKKDQGPLSWAAKYHECVLLKPEGGKDTFSFYVVALEKNNES